MLRDKFMVDSYAFRVNETSRFHFQIGMHTMVDHVVLRLSELKDYGNSWIGKQEFNLNIIEKIVGAGDYSL